MTTDIRGVPVSTPNAAALQGFENALLAYQSYVGDPVEIIEATLTEVPEFTLGHVFRAIALHGISERRFVDPARTSLAAAKATIGTANDREKGLMHAAEQLLNGEWDSACASFEQVLVDYPRDVFALQSAHLMDFLRGDALNLRNRVARVLPSWDESLPGYGYVRGFYAFGLEESNQYAEAMAVAEEALEINPKDVWALHAKTHVLEMQGRAEEGIKFMESREHQWGQNNGFAFHNWWHLGLFHLDVRNTDKVLALLDRNIIAEAGDFAFGLVDVTAMLWRLHLLDVDVGGRLSDVADIWESKLGEEAGYYAFNDFHAALAFAATDRVQALDTLIAAVTQSANESERRISQAQKQVGLPLVKAAHAYGRGEFQAAAELFAQARDIAPVFGGSHAQRDVITLSIIESARRAGNATMAKHYLANRIATVPNAGLTQWLESRI